MFGLVQLLLEAPGSFLCLRLDALGEPVDGGLDRQQLLRLEALAASASRRRLGLRAILCGWTLRVGRQADRPDVPTIMGYEMRRKYPRG